MENLDCIEIDKDMKEDRKLAERFLLGYDKELKDYKRQKEEFLTVPKEVSMGGRSNLPGKPVEAQAIKSAQYDSEHAEYGWLRAVEYALRTFGERKRIFISVRQEAAVKGNCNDGPGRRGWVVYTQRRYSEEICKRFLNAHGWLGERTVKAWWAQILDCVVEMHLRLQNKNF